MYHINTLIVTECNYGPDCPNPCGNCNAGSACDRVDGTCSNGCADGFEGAQCLTGNLLIIVKQTIYYDVASGSEITPCL